MDKGARSWRLVAAHGLRLALSLYVGFVRAGSLSLAPRASASETTTGALSSLPKPPQAEDSTKSVQLYLQLAVNLRELGKIVPVELKEGHYWLDAAQLRRLGVFLPGHLAGEVAIDTLDEIKVDYDANAQRLSLTVPTAWLAWQTLGSDQVVARHRAQSSFGLLANYDLYGASGQGGQGYVTLWNELRVFGGFGVVSNTGTYRRDFGSAVNAAATQSYRRYDTSWRYSDEDRMLTYEAGDFVTRAMSWSSTVRLGGLQLSRDFSVRPDVVTYPLPQFSGQAAVPTTLDLFINGYKSSSALVQPGPFTLNNVPYVNGAGEATLVTTDALGKQVRTSVPFYVASNLLKPGLADYTLAVGAIRRRYGQRNFDYGRPAGSVSYRYGVNPWLSLESHAEVAPSFALGGLGTLLRAGQLGVFNAAFSKSYRRHNGYQDFYPYESDVRYQDSVAYSLSQLNGPQGRWSARRRLASSGQQYALGYQYTNRYFNLSLQRLQRSDGFGDLSTYDDPRYRLSHSSTQASASVTLGRYGNLGVGYFDVKNGDGSRTRLVNLSHNLTVWKRSSLYLSASRELGGGERDSGGNSYQGSVQLIVPLGDYGTASTSFQHQPGEGNYEQVSYTRTAPTQGGFGWNLAYTRHSPTATPNDSVASLTWRNPYMQLQGGIYGSTGAYNRWGETSGSLVWMDGDVFAANEVQDGFVVVSTSGVAEVPVSYENQPMGKTNRSGHLLMPWANAYYAGRYAINTLNLPADMQALITEQKVAVKTESGYLLNFPIRHVVAANIRLVDAAGKPLPISTLVLANGALSAYVGWDGMVYFEGLAANNRLQATFADGRHCTVTFDLDIRSRQIAQVGPLSCR